jgi:hypothetical protein
MPGFSLPARSLRGRSASLRSFPDDGWTRVSKSLISRLLLAIGRAISGVESIFLPALREGPVRVRPRWSSTVPGLRPGVGAGRR